MSCIVFLLICICIGWLLGTVLAIVDDLFGTPAALTCAFLAGCTWGFLIFG